MVQSVPHRFVPHGTEAPSPSPAGEIWLDVGGRCEGLVFDHHRPGSGASSAFEAVRRGWRSLLPMVGNEPAPTLVLHRAPDLDACSAAWLVGRILRDGALPASVSALERLVAAVSAHDQGQRPAGVLESDWATVVAMAIALEPRDGRRFRLGFEILERSFGLLEAGLPFEDVAARVVPERALVKLAQARDRYAEDRRAGRTFSLRLLHRADEQPRIVHGLALGNPRSALFKQLARADADAPGGAGWALLVVSRSVAAPEGSTPLWRHVISVDPDSGYQLAGLGEHLDEIERARWPEESSSPAWYDGAGHGFTIVDSPALKVADRDVLASRLEPGGVVGAVASGAWLRAVE